MVGCEKCQDGLIVVGDADPGNPEVGPDFQPIYDFCDCELGNAKRVEADRESEELGRNFWAFNWAGVLKDELQGQDPLTCEWSILGRTGEELRLAAHLTPVQGVDSHLAMLIDYTMFDNGDEDGPAKLTANVQLYSPTIITEAIKRYIPTGLPSQVEYREVTFDVRELQLASDFLDGRALVWARDLLGRTDEYTATQTNPTNVPVDVAARIEQMCANVAEHMAGASRVELASRV